MKYRKSHFQLQYISVDCATAILNNGDIGFCYCNTCTENEGHCDSHDECQDGLACGSNNCPATLGFDSEVDCCYEASVGDDDFCTTANPCREDEGDCDSNDECQSNLYCQNGVNCPESLGFSSDVNCCTRSGCKPQRIILMLKKFIINANFVHYLCFSKEKG